MNKRRLIKQRWQTGLLLNKAANNFFGRFAMTASLFSMSSAAALPKPDYFFHDSFEEAVCNGERPQNE